jgi:hypothetical protein
MAKVDAMDEPVPTLAEGRRILSKISGNLYDTIRAERDARVWRLVIYANTSALAKLYRTEGGNPKVRLQQFYN